MPGTPLWDLGKHKAAQRAVALGGCPQKGECAEHHGRLGLVDGAAAGARSHPPAPGCVRGGGGGRRCRWRGSPAAPAAVVTSAESAPAAAAHSAAGRPRHSLQWEGGQGQSSLTVHPQGSAGMTYLAGWRLTHPHWLLSARRVWESRGLQWALTAQCSLLPSLGMSQWGNLHQSLAWGSQWDCVATESPAQPQLPGLRPLLQLST